MTPTYSSRPSMNRSAIASVPIESCTNLTRSFSLASSSTTDACAIPIDASWVSDLTMTGNFSRRGSLIASPRRKTANSGTGIR